MKQNNVIKPISGSQHIFKISTKRILSGVSKTNKSGNSYSRIDDLRTTRLNFQKIVSSLPNQPGILIIEGHTKSNFATIQVISSKDSVRASFSKSNNTDRFQSLLEILKEKSYDYLLIQLGQLT
jgi:uncharacterized iron-regulated protein